MSVIVGDVDLLKEIIDLRHQLIRTQMALDLLMSKNEGLKLPSPTEMTKIEDDAISQLVSRYPKNISKKQ